MQTRVGRRDDRKDAIRPQVAAAPRQKACCNGFIYSLKSRFYGNQSNYWIGPHRDRSFHDYDSG